MLKAQYRYVLQGLGRKTLSSKFEFLLFDPSKSPTMISSGKLDQRPSICTSNWHGCMRPTMVMSTQSIMIWRAKSIRPGLEFVEFFTSFRSKFCKTFCVCENSAEISNRQKSTLILWNEPKLMIMRSQPLGTMVGPTLYRMHFLLAQVLVI